MRVLLLTAIAAVVTACVHTNAAVLNPTLAYQKVCPNAVEVFTTPERVPSAYREIALLNSKGESGWTDEKGMLSSQRKKAAQLGANGLILGETKEPNAGTKIIGALFGTGAERKGKAIAIWIPADSIRVKQACGGTGKGAQIAADDELVQPQTFGTVAPVPAPITYEPAPQRAQPERLVQPVSTQAPPSTPQPTPAAPANGPHQDEIAEYQRAYANIPPHTNYIADVRTRKYYHVHCTNGLEIPEEARYYYQTESAAQADDYARADCS